MITTHPNTNSTKSLQPEHRPKDGGKWYSEDDLNNELIAAYETFKQSMKEAMKAKIQGNIKTAKKASVELFESLKQHKIKCNKIHLKLASPESFEAIIVLPQKAYISDSYNVAYNISNEIALKYNNIDFDIEFHFMPATKTVNNSLLAADGFILTYL